MSSRTCFGISVLGLNHLGFKAPPLWAGFFTGSDPVHSVIAIDMDFDRIFLITVYRPSLERWENDWKTRKK
jgi:hypothetical protein